MVAIEMEAQIIYREIIKPSSPTIHQKKPYKLTLLDQLTPTTYSPIIFFYHMNNYNSSEPKITIHQTLTKLKKSLSEILNLYYPFSGRPTDDNLYVDRFDEGVPFFEAELKCSMSDFLKFHETESLNSFLPCNPFTKEVAMGVPVIAFQVSIFTCGGIALGWGSSHKLVDATTASAFITSWTSLYKGDHKGIIKPDFNEPSLFFPARTSFPQSHLSLMESLWFTESNYITRRFVFNANAIATLKARAKGKLDQEQGRSQNQPTRIETLSFFIWKYCMEASKKIASSSSSSSGINSSKPSILLEAVNLRGKTNPPMHNGSTGNLFWWAVAISNPNDTNTELHELASQLREAIALYRTSYAHNLQGNDGFETMSKFCDQLVDLFSLEKPDIFTFTSWCNLPFTKPNFGWGKPYWVGVMGKAGASFRNLTMFIDAMDGKGIEAWITLDEKRMEILQKDPEFLAFASPNPRMSSL